MGRHRSRYVIHLCLSLTHPTDLLHSGIRLDEKRSFPCPQREKWYAARDAIYEEIMQKAWNTDLKAFGQSYEKNDVMDSAVLIMPLVFFLHGVRGLRR